MGLTKQYLEEHAKRAKNKSPSDTSDYEAFGRAVADLVMRTAATSDAVKQGEAQKVELTGLTATLQQNLLVCVDVQVCTPLGCVTAHVGI
jgi:hypothetical protein